MTPLRTPDLAVLIAYLAAIVTMGCWLSRRSRKSTEFMVAGGSLPGWAVGLSIFGTYVSSISFLANPGKSYAANWNPFVFSLSLPLAAWIATRWFVPFYRSGGQISAYTHLEKRFGGWARNYAAICYLLTQIARVGTILYLVALALTPITGWPVSTIILVTGVLVTIYTLLGGIEAVIWTDVVQSIVLTAGILVSLAVLFSQMPAGPAQVFSIAAEQHKFSLGSFGAALSEPTFWVVLLYGLTINVQNFGIDQSYVQRYITADSDRAAQRSVWYGALLYLPISALLFLLGTALFAFYHVSPVLLPQTASTPLPADAVFPHFIATELPVGMTGLLIAAVLAAAMSSVDSSLNSSATLVLCDFYQRYVRPEAGERESMRVLYTATLAGGVIGTLAALAMMQVRSVLDAWWQLAGVFSGGMLGLFLLGRLAPRADSRAAVPAVGAGVLVILWISASQMGWWPAEWPLRSPLHGFLTIVFGTATILLVGFTLAARNTGRQS